MKNPGKFIGFILNVAEEIDVGRYGKLTGNRYNGLKYHKIPLVDGDPIPAKKMLEAIELIQRHIVAGKVLVACHYGLGRSTSIVIGYLCAAGMGYGEALNLVSSRRPGTDPMPDLKETIRKTLALYRRYRDAHSNDVGLEYGFRSGSTR